MQSLNFTHRQTTHSLANHLSFLLFSTCTVFHEKLPQRCIAQNYYYFIFFSCSPVVGFKYREKSGFLLDSLWVFVFTLDLNFSFSLYRSTFIGFWWIVSGTIWPISPFISCYFILFNCSALAHISIYITALYSISSSTISSSLFFYLLYNIMFFAKFYHLSPLPFHPFPNSALIATVNFFTFAYFFYQHVICHFREVPVQNTE